MNLLLSLNLILPLAGVVFVTSITPGPNNVMVMRSGQRFGVAATMPHLFGIAVGFVALLLLVYAGVDVLVRRLPGFDEALTLLCSAYLLWLVVRLLRSQPASANDTTSGADRPWRFVEAAAFQFVNPKGWAMAATCAGIAAAWPGGVAEQAVLLASVSALVNLPCVWAWAAFGSATNVWLTSPLRFRVFNGVMAFVLLLTVLWMLEDLL